MATDTLPLYPAPGKFETSVRLAVAFHANGERADEGFGDVSELGWYALMFAPGAIDRACIVEAFASYGFGDPLPQEETAAAECAAILWEDEQGFASLELVPLRTDGGAGAPAFERTESVAFARTDAIRERLAEREAEAFEAFEDGDSF